MKLSWGVLLLPGALAAPGLEKRATPTVTIPSLHATIVGTTNGSAEIFNGVPFAAPPTGTLRLKPPQTISTPVGFVIATATSTACPQMEASTDPKSFPGSFFGILNDLPFLQQVFNLGIPQGEDCLIMDIRRPVGTTASSKLPVVFWIFGGSFALGSPAMYDGTEWVQRSVEVGKPVIHVNVNYRVNGFGFMPGKEALKGGAANLGLLDQRLGMKWVADNIAAWGGDPEKVTLWGESAGAWSLFDQLALYDGDHTYKGKPLFRGAIINSGNYLPALPMDSQKGQTVYDGVVAHAGCSSAEDSLECLRGVPYQEFRAAVASAPGFLSYSSLDFSYLPRPDGKILTQSPDALATSGKFAAVPILTGSQEDEGTMFSIFQTNITTPSELVEYLQAYYFTDATLEEVAEYVETYPEDPAAGSPYRTGSANNLYPEFKRLSAIQGDFLFTMPRRRFLELMHTKHPRIKTWSYIASYEYGTAYFGTNHGSDLKTYYPTTASPRGDKNTGVFDAAVHNYYNNFIYNLDPNNATGTRDDPSFMEWPQWSHGRQMLNFSSTDTTLVTDDFRSENYDVLIKHTSKFRQ